MNIASQFRLAYKEAYSAESSSNHGTLGIKILIGGSILPDLETPDIARAIRDAADKIETEVRAVVISTHSEEIARAAKEREDLVGLFPGRIFVEAIKNGYWGDLFHARHLPWFIVTTTVGRFRIGWRKRVIHLEWTETIGTKTADELFKAEQVTKGERYIHAWSLEDARRYVATVIESASK